MDAVGQQAITKYAEAEALAVPAEEFEVRKAVVINEENTLLLRARTVEHREKPVVLDSGGPRIERCSTHIAPVGLCPIAALIRDAAATRVCRPRWGPPNVSTTVAGTFA